MRVTVTARHLVSCRKWTALLLGLLVLVGWSCAPAEKPAPEATFAWDETDPRIGLRAGWLDAEQAIRNIELVASRPRPEGFFDPDSPAEPTFRNTDLAFRGNYAFVGNYHGFNVYDISKPDNPELRASVVCPGGQGDVSVYRDLLFMSAQETRGRIDCGTQGTAEGVDPERFRGLRIFDISDIAAPRQVATVQTCRGSHTHTLVADPTDDAHVHVYVSGTSVPRTTDELDGCTGPESQNDPNTSYSRIEVIRVPLSAPHEARIVSTPRVFADSESGTIASLWPGGDHGPGTQSTRPTIQCHDITAYQEIGLAAGACSGNGILFDITDRENPRRIDEVVDPSFVYWHSATFNNDATKVIFTDEWGGGGAPRCQATDPPTWGANAIFEIIDGKLQFSSYYKLPVPQTASENCVAHNGSLVPVPGRDIKVQSWYQGGLSVWEFTDSENPVEIAFFDRGPVGEEVLGMSGGYWSSYWYNGYIYGSEISRGFDVFKLIPSEHLSQNEIDAASLAQLDIFNGQHQPKLVWPPAFVVARAHLDQLRRTESLAPDKAERVAADLNRAEQLSDGPQKQAVLASLAADLEDDAQGAVAGERAGDPDRLRALAAAILALAEAVH